MMKSLISISLAIISLIVAVTLAVLYVQQNRTLKAQQAALQQQIQQLQQEIQQPAEPDKFTKRNKLVSILYDEKETKPDPLDSLQNMVTNKKKKREPAYNERLRRDAALQFVKLEYEAGKRWREIDLSNAFLNGVNLSRNELKKLNIQDALEKSDFGKTDLRKSYFYNTNLFGSNFKGADLERAYLWGATLGDAAFSGANMNYANLGGIKAEGASFIQIQAVKANFYAANLKGAYFWESHLEGASFWKANLEDTGMSGAFLQGASFRAAHMEKTNLSGTHLEGASFGGAHMHKVDLRGAFLAGANFYGASLAGAIVGSLDWINELRQLNPPVENFQFDDWSIIEGENEYGEQVYVLDGPLVARKPERSP